MNTQNIDRKKQAFNQGHSDAMLDASQGRNRMFIEQGKTFCLPAHNKPYCDGYRKAIADYRGTGISLAA